MLALVRGNDDGWGSPPIVALFAAAAVMLAAFAAIERRVAEPMLPLGLFRSRAFTGVQLAAFAVSASLFALFLYLTLYLQNYLGYSPLQAGLRYLPITLVPFLVAPLAVALMARVPARVLMAIGLAGVGAGLLLMSGLTAGSGWTALLPGFIVAGVGIGLLNPVIADVAVSVVPKERSGMAAGINDTFRQVGVAVGVAAWGAIFLGRGADKISTLAAGTPAAAGHHPRHCSRRHPTAGSVRRSPPAPRGTSARRKRDPPRFPQRTQRDPRDRRNARLRRRDPRALAGPRAPDRARAARAHPGHAGARGDHGMTQHGRRRPIRKDRPTRPSSCRASCYEAPRLRAPRNGYRSSATRTVQPCSSRC